MGLLILRPFTPAEAASLPSSPPPFYPPVNHFYGPRPPTYRNTNVTINNNNYYNGNNIYKDQGSGVKTGPQRSPSASQQPARNQGQGTGATTDRQARAGQQQNNVMTDRNGNVYRQNGTNWEQNTGQNKWQPADKQQPGGGKQQPGGGVQPSGKQPSSSFDRTQMDQQMQNRERGGQRDMNRGSFNQGTRGKGRR